jgi:hypothetical protein
MVSPVEPAAPLVGGGPATWSPYALDGSLVHTTPPVAKRAQVDPYSAFDPSSVSLGQTVSGELEVGSISDHARKSAGGDADRAPDNVFVSNLEVPPVSAFRLASVVDSVTDGREGSSESFWTKDARPYQSMVDAEVQIVTSLTQPFEQGYVVIGA